MNVLKLHLRISILALLESGVGQREIERRLGVSAKTIRRYQRLANSPRVATGSTRAADQLPPPRPPALEVGAADSAARASVSACATHRAWIEGQVALGRNAVSIYQDRVERRGFSHAYNSVKRFVARLKRRAPERFDVLEFPPGEEAQATTAWGR